MRERRARGEKPSRCRSYRYSGYIVGLEAHCAAPTRALSFFFEGRRFTPFHRCDFPRWAHSIERKRASLRAVEGMENRWRGKKVDRETQRTDKN